MELSIRQGSSELLFIFSVYKISENYFICLVKMQNQRYIIAKNSDAKEEILKCAMYSYCGRIIYRKWDKKQKKFVKRSHVVVPIDCGVTSRGNEVLFAEDVEQHMQVKQFIIKQILSFENYKQKVKTVFPIKLDNIKRMFGIRKVTEEYDMAAGVKGERNLVAKELRRIAQEIYEFSGCEGHLYSDRKKTDPCSYDVIRDDRLDTMDSIARRISKIGKDDIIARRLVAYLTESQKQMAEHFKNKRKEGLSFGDYFKWDANGRCYIPLQSEHHVQELSKMDDASAKEIFDLLDKAGYVCPDYATGWCYEKSDTGFEKKNPPKVLTVLKKVLRNDKETFNRLSKAFNERESGSLKRKGQTRLMMCITQNAEDIAGMSTDRDWTSCMHLPIAPTEVTQKDLDGTTLSQEDKQQFKMHYGILGEEKKSDEEIAKIFDCDVDKVKTNVDFVMRWFSEGGQYYSTALKQVKYGGMVAYLIKEDDKDIAKPLARVAIKRLENGEGGFVFQSENRIYGDVPVARSCGFVKSLNAELEKSNATTEKGDSEYRRNDANSYSDSDIYVRDNDRRSVKYLCKADWREVYEILNDNLTSLDEDEISQIIDAHKFPPPKGMYAVFQNAALGEDFSDEFLDKYESQMDCDLYNWEHDIPVYPTARYEGDDAPRSSEEMLEFIKETMEDARYGDDYGDIDDSNPDEMRFSGYVSPARVVFDGYLDSVPPKVKHFALMQVGYALKAFYDDRVKDDEDFRQKYPSFAVFEEAFESFELYEDDDQLDEEVHNYIEDLLSWDDNISYDISIEISDIYDGDEENSMFMLVGDFTYITNDGAFNAYENKTLINTEDSEWKTKLRDYCEDLFDQIPNFY